METGVILTLPSGLRWEIPIAEAVAKLAKRAQLPGARVFDLAGESLREAKARGVSAEARLYLALPASWLVNSPAISRVLKRWALEPHREICLALVAALEGGPEEWGKEETQAAAKLALKALGDEPYLTEAISKALALLVPEMVPLLPPLARAFVLGEAGKNDPDAFVKIVDWFGRAAREHEHVLGEIARNHREVRLSGAGVLDRLLWFDSEGHAHFPAPAPT
jgi:hypothetical protein